MTPSVHNDPGTLSLASKFHLLSDYSIPILAFGVYQNWGEECYTSCLTAIREGYRAIDSARYYENEVEVGKAVRDSGLCREELFVTSKIYHPDFGYESTLRSIDESFEKFGLDYIDLYLIHSPIGGKQLRLDTWRALIAKRNEGKIRSIGVSNYNVQHIEELREAGLELPVVNQIELHPFCQQKPIIKYCKENKIVVQAYCPLIRGDFDYPVFHEISKKYGKTIPQVLLRWSLQHGFGPVPKSARSERIRQNAELYDFAISEVDMKKIDALDRGDDGACQWNPIHSA